jgi:Raf kinase inhibitor-like YbhB/YbcL family protein
MKKIMVIIALLIFAASPGYSQTNSSCKKKIVHHKVHKATFNKTAWSNNDSRQQLSCPDKPIVVLPAANTRCVIDTNGEMEYITDQSYTGSFPAGSRGADCGVSEELLVPKFTDMVVTSTAFPAYGMIPTKYTCLGDQVSPPLNVSNIPAGTQSLAIVMFDPHATSSKSTTYWLMWDVDSTGSIPENFINDHASRNPVNKQYGYQAVCPVSGTHYYHFKVYALDAKLTLGKNTTKPMLEKAMGGHVLAKGELIGQYNRQLE